jgi:hypothetical protein
MVLMSVTLLTFHPEISPLKEDVLKNMYAISVTLLTFHLEISPLKGVLQNMHLMLGNTADIPLTNIIIKITLFLKAYSYWYPMLCSICLYSIFYLCCHRIIAPFIHSWFVYHHHICYTYWVLTI